MIPCRKLVVNIGFDDAATRNFGAAKDWYGVLDAMKFPLRHPSEPLLDMAAGRYIQRTAFGVMRPLWDPRRMRAEIGRLGAAALERAIVGASWLERRRAVMRAESRR